MALKVFVFQHKMTGAAFALDYAGDIEKQEVPALHIRIHVRVRRVFLLTPAELNWLARAFGNRTS